MEMLLSTSGHIFFCESPEMGFAWLEDSDQVCGRCYTVYGVSRILLSRTVVKPCKTIVKKGSPQEIGNRTISRLDTLLHEALHAFFHTHGCHSCKHNNFDDRGHGRAFQSMAAKLAKVTESLFQG
ncbi:hypothetical protein K504DRAFT_151570 [Pleomassaria siparia CBS 279.74]|uniref:SprT-like domain-containing protein n=1 Tax=Pleomassaria siparia CBS 279.74 TaxID=1314801 RepID=A0A6G1KM87_9PLEO|nr:hypothetical protein K504DRAFT_151570 [Pleomassaria siparia CBS 279.74]